MKILVTGSKGFIGSELVKSLDRYDLITADIKDGIDLTDRDFWNNLEKVDIIFHLSAIVGVCNFTSTNAEKSYIADQTDLTFYNSFLLLYIQDAPLLFLSISNEKSQHTFH